nr:MAG TPA: hypothetical protein [Caudoviricetes sp.]
MIFWSVFLLCIWSVVIISSPLSDYFFLYIEISKKSNS